MQGFDAVGQAAQAGDREAFGELATRFEPMVYAIALRRLGNHSEAQELCQEVLVKAMQKIEQLKVPAAFGGWLRSITVRMAINRQVRRAPTIATEPQALDASCVESITPLDAVLASERAIRRAEDRPPKARRTVDLLRDARVTAIQGNYEESLSSGAADCHCGYTDPRDNHFAKISYEYTFSRTSAGAV